MNRPSFLGALGAAAATMLVGRLPTSAAATVPAAPAAVAAAPLSIYHNGWDWVIARDPQHAVQLYREWAEENEVLVREVALHFRLDKQCHPEKGDGFFAYLNPDDPDDPWVVAYEAADEFGEGGAWVPTEVVIAERGEGYFCQEYQG
jgi:hypothetical protein